MTEILVWAPDTPARDDVEYRSTQDWTDDDWQEYFDRRATAPVLGASECAAALGRSPYLGPLTLWRRKRGLLDDGFDGNLATRIGDALEWLTICEVAREYELTPARVGVQAVVDGRIIVSPDGVLLDDGGVPVMLVEAKVSGSSVAPQWRRLQANGVAPPRTSVEAYITQARVQAAAFDLPVVLAAMLPGERDIVMHFVSMNKDAIDTLESAISWVVEHLEGDVEPRPGAADLNEIKASAPDPALHTVTLDSHDPRGALIAERAALRDQIKELRAQVDEIDAQIWQMLGDGKRIVCGDDRVTRVVRRSSRVDMRALEEEHPDLVQMYRYETVSTYLR